MYPPRPRDPVTVEKRGEHRSFQRWIGQDLGCRQIRKRRVVDLESAVCRSATNVDDTLRNTLLIEVLDFLAKREVLYQGQLALSGLEGVLVVADWYSAFVVSADLSAVVTAANCPSFVVAAG